MGLGFTGSKVPTEIGRLVVVPGTREADRRPRIGDFFLCRAPVRSRTIET